MNQIAARARFLCVVVATALLSIKPLTAESAKFDTSSIAVERDGQRFEVVLHTSAAAERRGTVVLLHGFPGGAVGQTGIASRRPLVGSLTAAGLAVVEFNYLGSWSNPGTFSWFGGILDTEAVIRYLRSPAAASLGIDRSRITVVGHSYGGWVAMMTAARDPALVCVVTLAGSDLGKTGEQLRQSESFRAARTATYKEVLDLPAPPIRVSSVGVLIDDAVAHAAEWSLLDRIGKYQSKGVLLIAADDDDITPKETYFQPLPAALARAGVRPLRTVVIAGANHNFSQPQHRANWQQEVSRWITTECAR